MNSLNPHPSHRPFRGHNRLNIDLSPCPFCGKPPSVDYTEDGFAYIECSGDCKISFIGIPEDAVILWNNRVESNEVKRLREINAEIIKTLEFTIGMLKVYWKH